MDCRCMFFVLKVPILMPKDRVYVNHVMLATGVQVLEWRHLNCVQMERTVTQLVLESVFYVQQVLGEVLYPVTQSPYYPCAALYIHMHSFLSVNNHTAK